MINCTINPFATRYVRPGMVEWIASETQPLELLQRRFDTALRRRAAIVGPHGSGKSTLLEHLGPRLGQVVYRESPTSVAELNLPPAVGQTERSNVERQEAPYIRSHSPIIWLGLRRDYRAAERLKASRQHWQSGGLLILDGFEQLSWFSRWRTLQLTRQQRIGLLVTCHRSTFLRTLIKTHSSVSIVQKVIEQIYRNTGQALPPELTSPPMIDQLLIEERGNIREVLMRLYDKVQQDLPR